MNYIVDQTFEKQDYTTLHLAKGEYEGCVFNACNFNASNLSNINFIDCTFTNCNLSTASLGNTGLRNVIFSDCKMLGMHFENCNTFLFAVSFTKCYLNLSSFYKCNMKKSVFISCSLHEVDFTECDLSAASFLHCDFHLSVFGNTILEKADLRTSFNYTLDPELNKIKKAKFSLQGSTGLLHKYNIEIE